MNGTNTKVNSREAYAEKVAQLRAIIDDPDSNADYIVKSICKMYEILLENDQFDDEEIDHPYIAKRLIKCNRYIPNYILSVNNMESVVLGGLYLVADVCIMPTSMVRESRKNRYNSVVDPEMYGLMPGSIVNYGSIKEVNSNISVALLRDGWLYDWVSLASQYDYVTLS